MRGLSVLSSILIICVCQVAVRSQYYSDTVPYQHRPVVVTNLHFYMHEFTGTTAVVLPLMIPSGLVLSLTQS
ncbi:hypothetical protein Gotur_030515 [Gossypium turneri]